MIPWLAGCAGIGATVAAVVTPAVGAERPERGARRLVRIDRRQDARLVAVDDLLEGLLLRFLEQNRDQG
jgi:hypothetical protein